MTPNTNSVNEIIITLHWCKWRLTRSATNPPVSGAGNHELRPATTSRVANTTRGGGYRRRTERDALHAAHSRAVFEASDASEKHNAHAVSCDEYTLHVYTRARTMTKGRRTRRRLKRAPAWSRLLATVETRARKHNFSPRPRAVTACDREKAPCRDGAGVTDDDQDGNPGGGKPRKRPTPTAIPSEPVTHSGRTEEWEIFSRAENGNPRVEYRSRDYRRPFVIAYRRWILTIKMINIVMTLW